jgi:O-antigen/teichoic acid export membrane protein
MKSAGSPVFANLGAVGAAEIVARTAQLVTMGAIARTLGRHGLGIIGTGWAFYNVALPVVQYSPELVGIRELARKRGRISIIAQVITIKVNIAFAAILLAALGATVVYRNRPLFEHQVFAQCLVLAAVAFSSGWIFQGLGRFEISALLRAIQAVTGAVGLLIFLRIRHSPLVAPLSDGLSLLTAALLGFVFVSGFVERASVWRLAGAGFATGKRRRRALRKHGQAVSRLSVAAVCNSAVWSASILIAGHFVSIENVGLLTAAVRLVLIINSGFLVVLQLFYPMLANGLEHDRPLARELAANISLYATAGALLAYIPLALFAPGILAVVFGNSFAAAASVLRLLGLTIITTAAGSAYGYTLLAAGMDREFSAIMVCGAAASVCATALAFWLRPSPLAGGMLLVPVLAAQTLALAFACHRGGLVARDAFALKRFSVNEMLTLMRAR